MLPEFGWQEFTVEAYNALTSKGHLARKVVL